MKIDNLCECCRFKKAKLICSFKNNMRCGYCFNNNFCKDEQILLCGTECDNCSFTYFFVDKANNLVSATCIMYGVCCTHCDQIDCIECELEGYFKSDKNSIKKNNTTTNNITIIECDNCNCKANYETFLENDIECNNCGEIKYTNKMKYYLCEILGCCKGDTNSNSDSNNNWVTTNILNLQTNKLIKYQALIIDDECYNCHNRETINNAIFLGKKINKN
jgi:hypothetical protein